MNNLRLNLENYPSFITTNTFNNYPLFIDLNSANALISCIYFGRTKNWFDLITFVVMPDHLHLIIVPKEKNISQAMHSIKSFSSKEINRINQKSGQVWQSSFRDFTIYTEKLLLEKVTYIHNNPVRKGLSIDATNYKFSSANPIYETDIELVL